MIVPEAPENWVVNSAKMEGDSTRAWTDRLAPPWASSASRRDSTPTRPGPRGCWAARSRRHRHDRRRRVESIYPATVLADVPADARILKEEVFGPVAPITGFDTEEEGIAAANETEYGLAAYIYTRDLDRALRAAEGVESGMVGVNRGVISDAAAPFGGIKESGFGREGGSEGIEEYLDTKYIALTK